MHKEQTFLEDILKALVEKPEEIKIERKVDEMGVLYLVDVANEDLPKIIGKKGQNIKAIKSLLKIVGFAENVRATLKLNIPEKKNE